MGAIAVFDYTVFIARYPEFSAISQGTVASIWDEGTLWHRNDGTGPVEKPEAQLRYLNMMCAHLLQLNFGSSIQPKSPLVGNISSAHEGSVGVTVSNRLAQSPTAAWANQTQYGASYWSATAPYRTARYVAGRPRVMDPFSLLGRGNID